MRRQAGRFARAFASLGLEATWRVFDDRWADRGKDGEILCRVWNPPADDMRSLCARCELRYPEDARILLRATAAAGSEPVTLEMVRAVIRPEEPFPSDEEWRAFRLARGGLGLVYDNEQTRLYQDKWTDPEHHHRPGLTGREIAHLEGTESKQPASTLSRTVKRCYEAIERGDLGDLRQLAKAAGFRSIDGDPFSDPLSWYLALLIATARRRAKRKT